MNVFSSPLRKGVGGLVFAALMAPVLAQAQDAGDPILPPGGKCVYGFSKVLEGQVENRWTGGGCIGPVLGCRTASSDSEIKAAFRSNPSRCDATGQCDDSRELSGRLSGKLHFDVRGQRPCPYRGAYDGSIELTDATGVVIASGKLLATLGVGTHQKPCLGPTCPTVVPCETCYDVNAVQNAWKIGTEGIIDAPVTAGRYRGCRIRASIQADYFTAAGAAPLSTPWRTRGNLDGVLECPCSTPGPGPLPTE